MLENEILDQSGNLFNSAKQPALNALQCNPSIFFKKFT